MHVVVTGGAGFIGGHSVRELRRRGHKVTVIDDLSHGKRENVDTPLHVLDVRSPEARDLVRSEKPDAILHLAAQMDVRKSMSDPLFDASVNVLGTVNMLDTGVRRFVFSSSGGAVYGEQDYFPAREDHPRRPASAYGASKLCGEEYLALYQRAFGLSALALRYANVYGPGQDPFGEAGVVAIFLEKMLSGAEPIINGDGKQTRDYVHVHDVARINALAIESDVTGAVNVGTARETSVNDLAEKLGLKKPFRHGPAKPGEQRRSAIDPSAAGKLLGWQPQVALEEGLRATAQWFAGRKRA
ncbi:MAG: NAD-dependent epimerase/dehydratase family protein [Myxococcales bacterium]